MYPIGRVLGLVIHPTIATDTKHVTSDFCIPRSVVLHHLPSPPMATLCQPTLHLAFKPPGILGHAFRRACRSPQNPDPVRLRLDRLALGIHCHPSSQVRYDWARLARRRLMSRLMSQCRTQSQP